MLLPSFIILLLQMKSRGERSLTFFVVSQSGATTMPAATFLEARTLLVLRGPFFSRVWLFRVREKESLKQET
jgi:glucose-6-phosphate isomerase